MFTGLVETVGTLAEVRRERGGAALVVEARFGSGPLVIGESIAVSGPCLTVEEVTPRGFRCFASSETLARPTLGRAVPGTPVNLERALRADGRLGGHLVSGHVDGVARLQSIGSSGEARELRFLAPSDLRRYLAPKGSVALDGISLTVNTVRGTELTVMVIPLTLSATTLKGLRVGDSVNLEVDVIARYVESLMGGHGTADRLRSLAGDPEEEGG